MGLKENTKIFIEKAKPIVKQDLKQAYKNAKNFGVGVDKGLRNLNKLATKLGKKKLSNKKVFASRKAIYKMPDKPIGSYIGGGSAFFNDMWEREQEDIDPFERNNLFWGF